MVPTKHSSFLQAQIQFDMTAWVKRGTREEVGVITDFVDPRFAWIFHHSFGLLNTTPA